PEINHYNPNFSVPNLNEEQRNAADLLIANADKGFSVTLLDGVTGSGKTEVFCEAIAECLRLKKQALLLVPEIAMTAALINRLTNRFSAPPVVWHSGLTEKQKRLNWRAILSGEALFVIGARSALFLPYPNLGLIIADEEHEQSYKQEEMILYHGRDMAVLRANIGKIPIVLSSATPSLETVLNVRTNKYNTVQIQQRFGTALMPEVGLIDLRKHTMPASEFISPPLLDALKKNLSEQKQSMLFLNRRGYAPLTLCRGCGARLSCPHCSAWLIAHKSSNKLRCHHCDYNIVLPKICPECKAEDKLAACGPGVERIAEELYAKLPSARTAIMASDVINTPAAAQELVDKVLNKEIDVLIGTQIMAKGYHFPSLTLVGVIDSDIGLSGGDPRASERTFALLQQISGRSGRAMDKGTVMLQTVAPENPVINAIAKNLKNDFIDLELQERQSYNLPPFWRLISITLSCKQEDFVIQEINQLALKLNRFSKNTGVRILGPAPAPFSKLRGNYRHRLLLQAPKAFALSSFVKHFLNSVQVSPRIKLIVDVDPYNFL
ncbi:MAG: primosomal protein N', partial [Alphaproteobacteria bacterium]|nr:primosomal protein N' [Alphaproteobacteria bacterium]